MLAYINQVLQAFRDQHNFVPSDVKNGVPIFAGTLEENSFIPDGEYPMVIYGKIDNVIIKNGQINCCNFNSYTKNDATGSKRYYHHETWSDQQLTDTLQNNTNRIHDLLANLKELYAKNVIIEIEMSYRSVQSYKKQKESENEKVV